MANETVELAQRLYEAYLDATDGKSLASGVILPEWAEQGEEYRQAWRAASGAAQAALADPMTVTVKWQDGVIGPDGRQNGLQVEQFLQVAVDRLRRLNGELPDRWNSIAITHLEEAQNALYRRTIERTRAGVEGTHEQRSEALNGQAQS